MTKKKLFNSSKIRGRKRRYWEGLYIVGLDPWRMIPQSKMPVYNMSSFKTTVKIDGEKFKWSAPYYQAYI